MKNLFFIMVALAWSVTCAAQTIKDVTVREFELLMKSEKDAVILDLRTDDEIKEHGMVPNAMQLDYFDKQFERKLLALDKQRTYMIYCASGARSGEATELMKANGFTRLYHLPQGFNGWKKAKKPVVRVDPE